MVLIGKKDSKMSKHSDWKTWLKTTDDDANFSSISQWWNSWQLFLTKTSEEWKYTEKKNLIFLLYFQNAKEVQELWFTVIRKTNYKYMYRGRYSHFAPILTLRRSNSGIILRKVRIPTLPGKVRILTLRRTILEFYRFLHCEEHIHDIRCSTSHIAI